MTQFKIEVPQVEKISFIKHRSGSLVYAEFGIVKTYSNKTQAKNKVNELNALGYNVSFTMSHPFLIVQL